MQTLEIEVKFFIADLALIRQRAANLKGVSSGRQFEVNLRLDDRLDTLFKRGALLRLRKSAGRNLLTHKSLPAETDRGFKTLHELEIVVDDFEVTRQIIESLGFFERQRYEKWRETVDIGGTLVCLDEMPYGDFIEIEGHPDGIHAVTAQLGLDWDQRILLNYLEIFSRLKNALHLPFSDVTFENFRSHRVDPADVSAQLEFVLDSNRK